MAKVIKILLVDDDKDLVHVLKMSLELNGFKVITSNNGQEAYFKFRNEGFDVVVTDLQMPKVDGIELITSIQKISDVPIFVISASIEKYKLKLMDLKGLNVMVKPFDPEDLSKRIKDTIKTSSQVETPLDNVLKFRAGETVFEEQDLPNAIFIVKEGLFSVFKMTASGERISVATIKPGEVVGEMAVFTGQNRTTTVMAHTDGTLIRFPLDKVKETLNSQPPWFRAMMKTISTRLGETTSALAEAKSQISSKDRK